MIKNYESQRQQLLAELSHSGIRDPRILNAIASISREHFVDEVYRDAAYDNRALPIMLGQTISQPLMVAIMTQALRLTGNERVLEIGTGSGYQTAILSRLAAYVYSIERYPQLAYQAAARLTALKIQNVSIYVGDGTLGWPDEAPYDCILVTAAAPELPPQLLAQLGARGTMAIPVGGRDRQDLLLVQHVFGGIRTQSLGGCVFVPLVGAGGWRE